MVLRKKFHLYNTITATPVALSSQTGLEYSSGCSSSPLSQTSACSSTADVCRFNAFHLQNWRKYVDYYSYTDPGGTEGWVGIVGWPIADSLPTKWSPVNHRLGAGQWKSASQRPTSWPLYVANISRTWVRGLTFSYWYWLCDKNYKVSKNLQMCF